jgi:hypothetical protein
VAPLSVVDTIAPLLPTPKQVLTLGQLTAWQPKGPWQAEGTEDLVQVVPPSVVANPTPTQVLVLPQLTGPAPSGKGSRSVHELPPSVVFMRSSGPDAKHVLVLGQLTLFRSNRARGGSLVVQVTPPSVVVRIVPTLPTAVQLLVVGQLTAVRELPVGNGFSQTQVLLGLGGEAARGCHDHAAKSES